MQDNKIIPIRDQIAEQLRSDIIAGLLAPNEKLNEQALADRFGVSRGPIRDVLLQLTKEGLLVSKNNCGMSVNDTLDPALEELMIDIRCRLEVFALCKLSGKMTDEDFDNLNIILDRVQDAFDKDDFTEVTKADIDFHQYLLFKAGGNEIVNVWLPIVLRMRMNYKRIDNAQEFVKEHSAIAEALRNSNVEGAIRALKANIED